MFSFDRDGVFRYLAGKGLENLGVNPDEIVGTSIFDLKEAQGFTDQVRLALAGKAFTTVVEVAESVFEVRCAPVYSKAGEFAGATGVAVNITQQHRAEKNLRESEERFARILETAPVPISIVDPSGRRVYANAAVEKTLGIPRDVTTDRVWNDPRWHMTTVDGEPFPESRHPVAVVLDTGKPVYDTKYAVVGPDGSRLIMAANAAPLTDASGAVTGVVVSHTDITATVEAERKLRKALEGTVLAMATAMESRDPHTAGHQRRVMGLACAIARRMDLPDDLVDGLRMAASIHDIGKIAVPSQILARAGRLTEAEFNLVKTHPTVGHNVLRNVEFPWPVAEIVLEHHERMDGSGYPRGLKGDRTLLEARILAVADVVEAMANHRPYRPALGIDQALAEITRHKGSLYDPDAVEACLAVFSEGLFKAENWE